MVNFARTKTGFNTPSFSGIQMQQVKSLPKDKSEAKVNKYSIDRLARRRTWAVHQLQNFTETSVVETAIHSQECNYIDMKQQSKNFTNMGAYTYTIGITLFRQSRKWWKFDSICMTGLSPAYQQLPIQPWQKCPTFDFRHQRRNAAILWGDYAKLIQRILPVNGRNSRQGIRKLPLCVARLRRNILVAFQQRLMRRSLWRILLQCLSFTGYASLSCTTTSRGATTAAPPTAPPRASQADIDGLHHAGPWQNVCLDLQGAWTWCGVPSL